MAGTLWIASVSLLLTRTSGLGLRTLGFSEGEGRSGSEGIPKTDTVPYIELAYLSAAPGFNVIANMSAIGWTPGVVVRELSMGVDSAQVYKKGCSSRGKYNYCDSCAIAFQGTNDAYDQMQIFNGTKTDFCGFAGVGGGFVDEMRGYFKASEWEAATSSLSQQFCGQVYSVGHSLGGAIASLFAFCVNTDGESVNEDKPYVTGIPKVRLVTFGALAVSDAPLWNGSPGNCFEGARLTVGDVQPDPSAEFQFKVLEWSAEVYTLIGKGAEAEHIQNVVIPQLEQLMHANQWAVLWDQLKKAQLQIFAPLSGVLAAAGAGTPGYEPITATITEFIKENEQELFFEYDSVPALLQPLQHPLAQMVKLSHPLSRLGAPTRVWSTSPGDFTIFDRENILGPQCNPGSSSWPSKTLGQVGFATAATFMQGIGLPNHQICCYIKSMGGPLAENCTSLLPRWSACPEPMWR